MITVLGYNKEFSVPDVIPKYIEEYAPTVLKELLDKCDRRWVDICLDEEVNIQQYANLERQIEQVTTENCGR